MMLYLQLYFEFFKTGLFAVGGGMATLPFLHDMAERTGWFTAAQLTDMVAVSESTPGPIGVNMASYVGFTTAGIPGAILATLGLITPSIIVILIIAAFLRSFRENHYVNGAFYGPSGFHCHGGLCRNHGGGGVAVPSGDDRACRCGLEGGSAGGSAAGADALGEAHEKAAPHCLYFGQCRHWRGVQVLRMSG